MALNLFELADYPNRIAASKVDGVIPDGAFFLDFSRPVERHRRFLGQSNRWIGSTVGLLVPVVHQGEQRGGYVVSVERSDPRFGDVLALWKSHYPSPAPIPNAPADGLDIIAHFGAQFLEDC